ncbi:MAG: hypothetical protein PSX37_08220 [bacterium]|nr:hypothetical protein [bacterium]
MADDEHEHRRRASALYGLIIGGSVLAATTADLRLGFVIVSVVATLAVYWIAETYVHVMTVRQMSHHELDKAQLRSIASDGLPLITISAIPLIVLLVADLAGMTTDRAADVALGANTALLIFAGYRIGKDAGLTGGRLAVSVAITGLLGLAIVGLKLGLAH